MATNREIIKMKTPNKKVAAQIAEITRQEYSKLVSEAVEKAPAVDKKLEELRKKLEKEMVTIESLGLETFGGTRKQRRLSIQTVSELLDLPVNEIMLHMLNCVKASNSRSLIELHLGHIYFYESE